MGSFSQSPSHPHDHPIGRPVTRRSLLVAAGGSVGALLLASCVAERPGVPAETGSGLARVPGSAGTSNGSGLPAGFAEFADSVTVLARPDMWLVESSGMPLHGMMVGITSWQQQVPTPQPYSGDNAWQIPRNPRVSDHPVSARTSLYRGAIALAVNGVPIFNALNNRGDDAFLAGELDHWGGHSGRADDYYYHVAPLHLQGRVGTSSPIAWALDGFPIYGLTESDGSAVNGLDEFNGHEGTGGYHYHASNTYPYINGGLHGVVVVAQDQIEPQPTTQPFRPAGAPLRGATITGFTAVGTDGYRLDYSIDGKAGRIDYTVNAGAANFVFTDPSGRTTNATYLRGGPRRG
jgi:hypothetical protein